MQAMQTLHYEERDDVAYLTLDRPQNKNRIDIRMLQDLQAVVEHLEDASSARVLVIRGAGDCFSHGIDFQDFALDKPPLNLRTSPLLIVLAHTLVAMPFVVRSVLPALRSINPNLRETAALLGASPFHVWRQVDLPITARAALVGAAFAFTISMGEFGATSLIARPERPTMPIAIYRFLGRPGASNYGQALAMSTLLMLICTLAFLAIERFRVGEIGEF